MRLFIFLILGSSLLAIWYLWPLPGQLSNHVINTGDPLFYAWNLAHNWQALKNPQTLLDTNIFYPETNTLALSDTLYAQTLLTAPILLLTGNPLIAENLYILMTFPLAAFSMYLLVHHLTHSRAASIVTAIFFAFSLSRLSQISHITIISSQFLPLIILFYLKFMETSSKRDIGLFIFFFLLTAASTMYFAVMGSIVVILISWWYIIYWIKQKKFIHHFRTHLYSFLPWFIPGLLFSLLIIYPYIRFSLEHPDIRRSLADSSSRSAQLLDYLRVLPNSWLTLLKLPTHTDEKALYPTLTVFLLAAYAIWSTWKNSHTKLFTLIILASFLLSLGPSQTFVWGPIDTGYIPLPYTFLYSIFPPLSIIRVPARFSIFVILGLSVLAAISLSSIYKHISQKRIIIFSVIILLFFIIETGLKPFKTIEVPTYSQIPPVYSWLKTQSGRVVVVELPIPEISSGRNFALQVTTPYEQLSQADPLPLETFRVYFSGFHKKNIVNGYSSLLPKRYQEAVIEAGRFPAPTSLGLFRSRGVTHFIIDLNRYSEDKRLKLLKEIEKTPELKLIETFADTQVYVWAKL